MSTLPHFEFPSNAVKAGGNLDCNIESPYSIANIWKPTLDLFDDQPHTA